MTNRDIFSTWSRKPLFLLATLACCTISAPTLRADSFTLQGVFTLDDQVALFDVVLPASSRIDFRTFGYAGGTTATGVTVSPGGFDPVLTLFDANGTFLADNDEDSTSPIDAGSGAASDAHLALHLAAGHYIVALAQYDNFSIGTLADGFLEQGNPHFTADPNFSPSGPCPGNLFRDSSGGAGRCRNGDWTVEFLNVASVTQRGVTPVPEPGELGLLSAFFLLLACARRKASSTN